MAAFCEHEDNLRKELEPERRIAVEATTFVISKIALVLHYIVMQHACIYCVHICYLTMFPCQPTDLVKQRTCETSAKLLYSSGLGVWGVHSLYARCVMDVKSDLKVLSEYHLQSEHWINVDQPFQKWSLDKQGLSRLPRRAFSSLQDVGEKRQNSKSTSVNT